MASIKLCFEGVCLQAGEMLFLPSERGILTLSPDARQTPGAVMMSRDEPFVVQKNRTLCFASDFIKVEKGGFLGDLCFEAPLLET